MMALNLIMEGTVVCALLLFLLPVDATLNDAWIQECGTADKHGQKECVVLGPSQTKGKVNVSTSLIEGEDRMFVLCHPGWEKEWYRLWINSRIRVLQTEPNQAFQFIHGDNFTAVKQIHKTSLMSWWNIVRIKEEFSFAPFNVSCIGIVSNKPYTVDFQVKNPELWYIAFVIAGMVIFFSARSWSRNVALQYSTGISVGVVASLLIVIFIIQRFMPQKLKTLGYGIMLFSGSVAMYIAQKISYEFNEIMQNHWQYVAGYALVTGLISFGVIYRFGPVTDNRTLDLVRWSMQMVGLTLIYVGTQIPEASIAIIIIVLSVYNFPRRVIKSFKFFRYRFFKPKIRLLTEDEYMMEGQEETIKALDELRSFCQSPDCDSWRVVSRLQNPVRFAKFVEGDSHIEDNELLEHDSFAEYPPDDPDDNESETDFRLSTP